MPPDPTLRDATPDDAAAIAALHAASWRATYRGSLSDAYLDGPIVDERRAFWTTRFGHPPAGLITIVAEGEQGLVGFVCGLADHDPHAGSLIDNLHADPAHKGRGLGRRLMRAVGERLLHEPTRPPVHLFVLEANVAAAGFYARLGGAPVERLVKTEPDGSRLPLIRIAWPSLAAFIDGVG